MVVEKEAFAAAFAAAALSLGTKSKDDFVAIIIKVGNDSRPTFADFGIKIAVSPRIFDRN